MSRMGTYTPLSIRHVHGVKVLKPDLGLAGTQQRVQLTAAARGPEWEAGWRTAPLSLCVPTAFVAVMDGAEGLLVPTAVLDTAEKEFEAGGFAGKGLLASAGALNSSFGCVLGSHLCEPQSPCTC